MNHLLSKIIKAGLIVGTLDILSAFLYYFSKTGKNPLFILHYVASALFGKAAYTGGTKMLLTGLALHYAIAFTFTLFFFWLFPKLKTFATNRLVTGIIYGLFVWSVMNLVVVPLSKIPNRPLDPVNAIINAVILILCIGIPLSFMANRFYKEGRTKLVTI